jgi:hypothetical protein
MNPLRERAHRASRVRSLPSAAHAPSVRGGIVERAAQSDLLDLQRQIGNQAVTSALMRTSLAHHTGSHLMMLLPTPSLARQPAPASPKQVVVKDKPIDVVEAIVHVMSARGLAGDVGPQGENISSPRYAQEVTKTVQEPDHVALLWVWHLLAVGDPITTADAAKVAEAHGKTLPLLNAMKADKRSARLATDLAARYMAGYEAIAQTKAREQADEMIDVGVAAATKGAAKAGSDDAQLLEAIRQAQKVLNDGVGALRRVVSPSTTAKQTAAAQAQLYARSERYYMAQVMAGEEPPLPWPEAIKRAQGIGGADAITLLKGGLDAASAIVSVADPKARQALFRERSNYFGSVAQGADINKVLWQFVSGSIAVGGGVAYGVCKVLGKAELAENLLDSSVKGVANVGAALNLAGLVHGAFVLADPDASADEKAAAAVEVTTSAVGIAGFAARWTPRLALAAKWSGPISASLTINFYLLKLGAGLQQKARVGLSRLDWVTCYRAAKSAAIEVQQWQRRLAVTTALLAVETDPRRKIELRKYADAFRFELVEGQMKPFLQARLASKSQDDDAASCGKAFNERLAPLSSQVGSAAASDDAALGAGAAFLGTIEQALVDWDHIVMAGTH